jgi:hypothetical protein
MRGFEALMKLSEFESKLERLGVSWDTILARHKAKDEDNTCGTLIKLIDRSDSFSAAIMNAFPWIDTPEGHKYWSDVANEKPPVDEDMEKFKSVLFPDSQYGIGQGKKAKYGY